MRAMTQETKDYFKETVNTVAYFMDIVCKNGDVVRINSTDRDIDTVEELVPEHINFNNKGGVYTYKAGGYIPSEYSYSSDGSVQKLDISGLAQNGFFDSKLVKNNFYEGAEIFISICNYKDLTKRVSLSRGFIGNFEIDSNGKFTCEYRGFSQKMNNSTAKLYSYDCRAELFDNQCKVIEGNYVELGIIDEKVDNITYKISGLSNDADYYIGGKVVITSGEAKQLTVQVRDAKKIDENTIQIEFIKSISISPKTGDSLNIRPGCDKTLSTCISKFNNKENFRGEPFVPGDNVFNILGDGQNSQEGESTLLSGISNSILRD